MVPTFMYLTHTCSTKAKKEDFTHNITGLLMAESKTHLVSQNSWFHCGDNIMKNNDYYYQKSTSPSRTSFIEDSNSMVSNGSFVTNNSSDTEDDVSSSSNSNGALYDLSEIMAQLPIKRGLSKFYQGKSESFTSLSRVTSVEDLVKKVAPYRKKLKASKSFGTGLSTYKSYTLPKAVISKKTSRNYVFK